LEHLNACDESRIENSDSLAYDPVIGEIMDKMEILRTIKDEVNRSITRAYIILESGANIIFDETKNLSHNKPKTTTGKIFAKYLSPKYHHFCDDILTMVLRNYEQIYGKKLINHNTITIIKANHALNQDEILFKTHNSMTGFTKTHLPYLFAGKK
jgi:hypothetical protein